MKEWIINNWPIFIAVLGWIVTLATDHQKLMEHEKSISELRAQNKQLDIQLAQINLNLTELNVKMEMLIKGKVKTGGNE